MTVYYNESLKNNSKRAIGIKHSDKNLKSSEYFAYFEIIDYNWKSDYIYSI